MCAARRVAAARAGGQPRHGGGAAMTVALAVIAKAPQPGRVKTRLCPPCTPLQAAALARAALADTLAAVRATPAPRRVLVLDGVWAAGGLEVVAQRGDGL